MDIEELYSFAKKAYKGFDASHDYNHAIAVSTNTMIIANKEIKNMNDQTARILLVSSLLHDAQDHKYRDKLGEIGVTLKEFEEFMSTLDKEVATKSRFIIDNISWSKRKTSKKFENENDDLLRKIVQDADWLEALGKVGLERCIEFVKSRNGNVPKDVCDHIKEKLLLIPDELNTETAREMAKYLVEPLNEYLYQLDI